MKKFFLAAIIGASGLLGFGAGHVQAATSTNGLPSTFAIVGLFSPTNSSKTTTNSSGTVITETAITKAVKITNKDMLNLLATEFTTNFPAGAQLAFNLAGNESFVVLDKSGNLFLNVSSNAVDSSYRFSLTNGSGTQLTSGKSVQTKTSTTTNMVETIKETASDYSIYYTDGNGNDFHFIGVVAVTANAFMDATTDEFKSISILLSGSGGGTFFNPADNNYDEGVFTKASWKASGKNVPGGL